ncbi:MAG: SDR family oxidoreductase [Proteobacteria bacterium]|nr:SDR family oxidoreductase [Pseudomonadota bacterium]
MKLGLENKRAIVGGSSKGLGYAVARSLLKEGAEVVIAARDADVLGKAAEKLEKETGRRPIAVPADLTRPEDRERLVEEATRQFGGVDILVSNAGGPPSGPFLSHGLENWQLAIDLALGSMTHLSALVLPKMKEQGFGRIGQIVSIAGLEVIDGLILSNASRPAVLGFAKALAREAAPHGILVNSICPGIFMTDRMQELASERSKSRGITVDQYLEEFSSDIPLGRPGNPEELGDLAAFLCSPRNTYITGAAITIDGGKTRRLY